ncbi:MAG TPA: Ig-like domain-containing protein [Candidatus Rifleibacterium sp.]|nr:Ig-like domain-containing protein [Candidatus Rifleibacterium sp.]HPT45170.1 Ig-like domain-containing protein [Candidatus Rifleibacterium sp.]
MNRWKRAAIFCAIAAAISNSSPVAAALDRTSYAAETAAINVAKHFPVNMATGISPETPLTVEFGGAVNQSFYQSVNFSLFHGTEPIDGELFYNPAARQVMFKAKQPLNAGQTYTAQISYYDGLGRTSEKVWSFQTAGAGNSQTPGLSSAAAPQAEEQATGNALVLTNANMGSGSIRSDMPMEISFSEPIDIVTLKSVPIQLFEDNRPVGVDYRLSRDMKTLTVSPRSALKPGSAYAIAVEKTLASTNGSRLRKKTLIPFTLSSGNEAEPSVSLSEIEEMPAPAAPVNRAPARQVNNEEIDNPFYQQPSRPAAQARPLKSSAAPRAAAPQVMARTQAEAAQVVGLAPQNGTRITNLTQPVTIAFNEEIMPDTLNEFTFRLEDDFGPVPARIHYFKGNKQATLTPVGLLDSNKTYRVIVTQGITDTYGRPIRSGINTMFTTVSPTMAPATPQFAAQPSANPRGEAAELEGFETSYADPMAGMESERGTQSSRASSASLKPSRSPRDIAMSSLSAQGQAPADRTVRTSSAKKQPSLSAFRVTSIFPGADSNNVARKAKIAVHFSEIADPRTVNNINISVFGNQVRVEGKVTYDRQQNRAVFEPATQLEAKTDYKVIVSDKIRSKMGEQLTQRFTWQFSTTAAASRQYMGTQKSVEADSSFYIPLVDSKMGATQAGAGTRGSQAGASFNFVPAKHWAFKTMRHITNRGILNTFPFAYTDSVTRYEFASAINSALNNLKSMQYMSSKPRLKVNDMVQLQQLVVEFRGELKSYGVNTTWFEGFLQQQGVNLQQVEARVQKLNR